MRNTVEVTGPGGRIVIPEEDLPRYERQGYTLVDDEEPEPLMFEDEEEEDDFDS